MRLERPVHGPRRSIRFNGAQFVDGGRIALGKWTDFVFFRSIGARVSIKIWLSDEGAANLPRVLSGATAVPAEQGYLRETGPLSRAAM